MKAKLLESKFVRLEEKEAEVILSLLSGEKIWLC